MEVAEHLWWEARYLVEHQVGDVGQGVANAEIPMAHKTDDVPWVGGLDGLSILPEQTLRVGEAQGLRAAARVRHRHVLREDTRADADEREAVTMVRVHVRLDFEDKRTEAVVLGRDAAEVRVAWHRRQSMLDEEE